MGFFVDAHDRGKLLYNLMKIQIEIQVFTKMTESYKIMTKFTINRSTTNESVTGYKVITNNKNYIS